MDENNIAWVNHGVRRRMPLKSALRISGKFSKMRNFLVVEHLKPVLDTVCRFHSRLDFENNFSSLDGIDRESTGRKYEIKKPYNIS